MKLTPEAQDVLNRAKASTAFISVDASKTTKADRRELSKQGLSFTTDRMRIPMASFGQEQRAKELRNKITNRKE